MKLTFEQKVKTTLEARFDVLQHAPEGVAVVGEMGFRSYLESGQGNWSGHVGNKRVELEYAKARIAATGIDESRPYELKIDGLSCGVVKREADVTAAGAKLNCATLEMEGRKYAAFPFSRGRKGYRYPIFENDVQIAEIHKDCKVVDDLHEFEIVLADGTDPLAAVVMCCYVFTHSWWYPGPARKHHKHFYVQKATKPAIAAYDEGFFDRCR